MDAKTLEYMGERVDKARAIQKKIKFLQESIKYADGKSSVKLYDHNHNGPSIEHREFPDLARKVKAAILAEVEKEIALLEQELAEL